MKAFLLAIVLVLPLRAQETPPPVTTADPSIPIDKLALRLVPLTVGELKTEAAAWRELVKVKATEIAEVTIAGESTRIDALKAEEKQLLHRFDAVLDSWAAKGGEPDEFRAYAIALRGADLDVEDPSSFIAAFRRWVEAEDGAIKWAVKAGVFLLIVLIAWIAAALLANFLEKALARHTRSSQLLDRFVVKLVRRLVLLVGLLVALSTLGVNVGALVALIGGGAFILGFALQDTLSNFANGVMLMIYQPFDIGDAVEIGGVTGSVDSVNLVNTTIRSWDNKIILVPNKSVWGQVITNITGADTRRVDLVFGVGYGDDLAKVQDILERVVSENDLVLAEPAPMIKVDELADSSVNFICRPWCGTSDFGDLRWELIRRVKEEFDAAGINIPYPQRDLHVIQTDPVPAAG